MAQMTIRVRGRELPGLRPECGWWTGVHVGLQVGREVPRLVAGDAAEAVFEAPVEVVAGADGGRDFRGKAVQGPRGDRFLYLSWGEVGADGRFAMFRRAKLKLDSVPDEELRRALETGGVLEAQLPLRDGKGHPICATVKPPVLRWQAVGG
jgi:hypothetical protein